MRQVYLDHQSATPVLPEALEAMRPFFAGDFGNPSSAHHLGLRAREAVAAARAQIAALIHADSPDEIIFTSDGTESANLAIKGSAYASQRRGNHIVTSQIEHPSVIHSTEFLETQGFITTRVKVDRQGFIDPADVRAALTDQTVLIAVHFVNHDIGTIEPIREISEIAGREGIALYVDAEAGAGWLPIDVQALGAHLLSFSPHRFYGPKGVGVLYRNRRARLASLLHGGGQENGWRSGIENVPAIVGAGVAAAAALREGAHWSAHSLRMQQRLWDGLRAGIPYVQLNGPEPGLRRAPTNLNISTEFIEGESQVLLSDMHGIAVAGAMGCVSKSIKVSHVLSAIGLSRALAQGAVMMSPGKDNTEEEMDYVIETFAKIVGKLRGMSPTWDEFEKGTMDSIISPRQRQ
ncbi:MAG: cysteine desulfurase family protein [Verrucomicrobiota bacterium]|jgi:cysteine desulfurase